MLSAYVLIETEVGMPLQPVGLARSDPVGLLLPEAAATLPDQH
jgi:hypothetical protein